MAHSPRCPLHSRSWLLGKRQSIGMTRLLPQKSADNPGWRGEGIPTLRALLLSRVGTMARLFVAGKMRACLNKLCEIIVDLGNFHIWSSFRATCKCPACGYAGPSFIATSNARTVTFQSKCPQCDSRSRHRGLIAVLPRILPDVPSGRLLFFAPERILLDRIRSFSSLAVVTTDFNSTDVDCPREDIQCLTFSESSFNVLLCNHVLEHVADDQKALEECARVLVPGGKAVFTVPGDFRELCTRQFKSPDGNGHWRHYGRDVIGKLEHAFGDVQAIDMGLICEGEHGVRTGDFVFVCTKLAHEAC